MRPLLSTLLKIIAHMIHPEETSKVMTDSKPNDAQAAESTDLRKQMDYIDKAAAAWAGSIGTLTGILGVAGITVGQSTLEDRVLAGTQLSIYALGIFLLVVILVLSTAGTLYATSAAAPDLKQRSEDDLASGMDGRMDFVLKRISWSKNFIYSSVVTLLMFAILVLVSSKTEDPPTPYSRVLTPQGVYCGTLVTVGDTLAIFPVTSDPPKGGATAQQTPTKEKAIPLPGDVSAIEAVGKCPYNKLKD